MAIVFNEYTIGGKVKEGVVVQGADVGDLIAAAAA